MKRAPRVAATLAIISLFAMPSWAQRASADSGNATAKSYIPNVQLLDNRIGMIGKRVESELGDGRISNEEADNYRSALERIATLEAHYSMLSGSLSGGQQLQLNTELDHLELALDRPGHDRQVAIFDTVTRENQIQNTIQQALIDGRLTAADADLLTGGLEKIRSAEKLMKGSPNNLSYSDLLVVSFNLDSLLSRYAKLVGERNLDIDLDKLANDISKSLSASATESGASSTKALEAEAARLISLKGKLSSWKLPEQKRELTLSLAAQLERLKQKNDLRSATATILTPVQRQAQLDKEIATRLTDGRLTPADAHEFRAELGAILSEPKAESQPAQGVERLSVQLERLSGRIMRAEQTGYASWPGLDTYLNDLSLRVAGAQKAGRITDAQAASFHAGLDKVLADKSEYQKQGMNAAQALDLAMRLQATSVQLHHDMRDRNVSVPDINTLQANLDKLVADGVDFGHLRSGQQLSERLAHINELQANYQKSPAGLDDRARLAIAEDIARTMSDIRAQIRQDVKQLAPLDARIGQLQKDVSNAAAMGIISVERATQYKTAIDIIYAQASEYRQRGLTAQSSLALCSDIGILEQQLQDELREDATTYPQLAARCRDLEQQVGRQLAAGRISISDANEMIAALHQAARSSSDDKDGGISHGEGLRIAYDIEMLSNRFENMLRNEIEPIVDIEQKEDRLDQAIANGLISGQLTIAQAQHLKRQLSDLLGMTDAFHSSGAGMSYLETLALSTEMDRLGTTIDANVKSGTGSADVDTKQADLKKRIQAALVSARLTSANAQILLEDLDRIEQSEMSFRTSEESLNYAEALALALDLDRVQSRLIKLSTGQLSLRKK